MDSASRPRHHPNKNKRTIDEVSEPDKEDLGREEPNKRVRRHTYTTVQLKTISAPGPGLLTPISPPSSQKPTLRINPTAKHVFFPRTELKSTEIKPSSAPTATEERLPRQERSPSELLSPSISSAREPSPQTPIEYVYLNLVDEDFGRKVCEAYANSISRENYRVVRYGREVAENWKRGSTPEEAREAWILNLEEQQRMIDEPLSDSDPEDDKQAWCKRKSTDSTQIIQRCGQEAGEIPA
ncbi:MAG: hypothetical protein Q9211_001168 [Gyalolechia sp. 1 TL-2023]